MKISEANNIVDTGSNTDALREKVEAIEKVNFSLLFSSWLI